MTARVYVYLQEDYFNLQKFDVGFIEKEEKDNYTIFFLRNGENYNVRKNLVCQFDIRLTGDRFENKVCDRCYKLLNTDKNFSNNRIKKDNIITKRPSCKECRKIKDGVSIPREQRLKWESNRPVDGSLFTCPICKKTTIVGVSKVVLDHNHSTGNVRGWLCESCNTGIGRFDDDMAIIENGIKWLEKTNS